MRMNLTELIKQSGIEKSTTASYLDTLREKRKRIIGKKFPDEIFEAAVLLYLELEKWEKLWVTSSSSRRYEAISKRRVDLSFLIDELAKPIIDDDVVYIKIAHGLWKMGKDISACLVQRQGHEKLDKNIAIEAHKKLLKFYPPDDLIEDFKKMEANIDGAFK